MQTKADMQRKERFVDGDISELRIGGYGGTVTLKSSATSILMTTTKPKRRQKTYEPNSRQIRETLVRAAETGLKKLGGSRRRPSIPAARTKGRADLLTNRDVWVAYLESLVGPVPEDCLGWGRPAIEHFLLGFEPEQRRQLPACDSISAICQAARSLHAEGVVPLDANFDDCEAGKLSKWAKERMLDRDNPLSAHSVKTYLWRYRTAIRTFSDLWPHRWGGRVDPTRFVKKIPTAHIKPPEIDDEQARALITRMMKSGKWRVTATASVAHSTARRVGAVAGRRTGLHLDAPPLTAADFHEEADGTLMVTWRADVAKGKAYLQGDVVQPATEVLKRVYRWLVSTHPNPLGPEHPLIWDQEDPSRAASYASLRAELDVAWREAFGAPRPKGLLWHGFSRGTITTISDLISIQAAAEFSGRSVRTAADVYKRTRPATQVRIAQQLDVARGTVPTPRGASEMEVPLEGGCEASARNDRGQSEAKSLPAGRNGTERNGSSRIPAERYGTR
jgi:hypothetical protein